MPRRQPVTLPSYLDPGEKLTIKLENSATSLHATVEHCLPLTTFQVVVATLLSSNTPDSGEVEVGQKFTLKIFDPRFFPRYRYPDSPEWSYAKEMLVESTGRLSKPVYRPDIWDMPEGGFSDEEWEEFYYYLCAFSHRNEVEAYSRLRPLQGTAVPRFYASGSLDLSLVDPGRAICPPVILIEYIDNAVSLRHLDAHLLTLPLIESLLHIIDTTHELGVCHGDLNIGNILFSPPDKPTRALLVDFADALYREEDDSDEDWQGCVTFNNASGGMRGALRYRLGEAGLPIPRIIAPRST